MGRPRRRAGGLLVLLENALRSVVVCAKDADHQAVSNLIGIPSWGPWGSTMVFDTAFITYFARYAHAAYPFIEGFDNCYARQHENGFICRESDRENREVYVVYPVNPPLFAWAEWENYRLSGDVRRLEAVFLPITKHYEWWMTYQRHLNGLYWTNGVQEADDSPRNTIMHYAVSATSYQALAALYLGRIARAIGREDMAAFFDDEHRKLGDLVNRHFWDAGHRIYNDLAADGRFITELKPGQVCKHCHMFWPMLAEVATSDRVNGMVAELTNPASFCRRNGVPSLSADSAGYAGGPEGSGQYWRGSVWPPIQCMVQQGLAQRTMGTRAQLAEKYASAVVETYRRQHDVTENLAPIGRWPAAWANSSAGAASVRWPISSSTSWGSTLTHSKKDRLANHSPGKARTEGLAARPRHRHSALRSAGNARTLAASPFPQPAP